MLYAWAHHYSVHSFQFIHDSQSNSRCKWVCLSPIQRVIWGGLFILARLLCSLHTSNNNQNSIKLNVFLSRRSNRFTGLWLIRATSIRIGDYLNECKIWHARQWTEFHSNIDWLLSFALYLFMVSTRAAEKMQSHWNSINSRLTLHHTSRDQLTLAESSFFCCRAWISHEHFCVLFMLLFAWQQWWRWRQPKRRPAVMLATRFYYLKIDIRMNCKSLTKQKIHLCECANE